MQQLWRKAVLLLVGASLMELAMSQGVQERISSYTVARKTDRSVRYVASLSRGQLLARKQLASSPAGGNLQHIVGVPNVLMCGTIAQARVQLPVQAVERGRPHSGWAMQRLLLRSAFCLIPAAPALAPAQQSHV